MRELGCFIQTKKSVLTPSQAIVFLGFIISSRIYILMKVLQVAGYITDGISPSRGHWHKAMLEQINVLGLKAIKIWIYTYCKNKDFLHLKDMVWQSHSCQLLQQHQISNLQWYCLQNMGFLCQKLIVGCSGTFTRNNQYWG